MPETASALNDPQQQQAVSLFSLPGCSQIATMPNNSSNSTSNSGDNSSKNWRQSAELGTKRAAILLPWPLITATASAELWGNNMFNWPGGGGGGVEHAPGVLEQQASSTRGCELHEWCTTCCLALPWAWAAEVEEEPAVEEQFHGRKHWPEHVTLEVWWCWWIREKNDMMGSSEHSNLSSA
jgi:hypothetical protein